MSLKGVKAYMQKRKLEKAAKSAAQTKAVGRATLSGDKSPRVTGELNIQIRKVNPETGAPSEVWRPYHKAANLVVTQAEGLMAQMAIGAANSALSYIELGDPVTPTSPVLADTTLEQTTAVRKAVVVTASGNTVTAEVTFLTSEGNGFTFTEAGLFTGILGAGSMFARKVFPGITKTVAFELKLSWIITFVVSDAGGDCCSPVSLVGPGTITNETEYNSTVGGEASIAATFDFTVGAGHLDVFLKGQRLVRGKHYTEVAAGGLTGPVGGPAGNKGINLIGFTLIIGDEVYIVQRTLA